MALGQSMGLRVLAEGVETQAHWQLLRSMAVGGPKGYWFAKPCRCRSWSSGWHSTRERHQRASLMNKKPTWRHAQAVGNAAPLLPGGLIR